MKKTSIVTALLGIVIGILLTLVVQSAANRTRKIKTSTRDWQKVNLILKSIEENYVDTVDRA